MIEQLPNIELAFGCSDTKQFDSVRRGARDTADRPRAAFAVMLGFTYKDATSGR